jgi:hypothetical protein
VFLFSFYVDWSLQKKISDLNSKHLTLLQMAFLSTERNFMFLVVLRNNLEVQVAETQKVEKY